MEQVQSVPPPPDLKTSDKDLVALAKFLRYNDIIKQRPAILGGQRWDMFRIKRAVRALLDPSYEKARGKNQLLPEIPSREAALKTLARLPMQRFAYNVTKLETEDALAKGLKPVSGVPVVMINQQQKIGDNEYMIWFYNPTPLKTYLYGVGILAIMAFIIAQQLSVLPPWTSWITYYVSWIAASCVFAIMFLGVLRLILFVPSALLLPRGFWLFPNLFADVGVIESFFPLWSWGSEKTLPKKQKQKKRHSKAPKANAQGAGTPIPGGPALVQTPNGAAVPPGPGQAQMHPLMKRLIEVAIKNSEARLQQVMKENPPKTEAEAENIKKTIFQEELGKVQQNIAAQAAQAQAQAAAQAAQTQ